MTECPECKGEGWFYIEQAGRRFEHPIREVECGKCRGLGEVAVERVEVRAS